MEGNNIIRGLENWIMHDCTAKPEDLENAINYIYSLQAEIEELKSPKFGNWKVKFFKAQEEIERLTEIRNSFRQEVITLNNEKLELQKQVDELTEKLGKVLLGVKADEVLTTKGVEQAVKDTAKEIYSQLLEWIPIGEDYGAFIDNFESWLKERYGIEVE